MLPGMRNMMATLANESRIKRVGGGKPGSGF
jgi:hypothetical protein